ncbi:MAG TPA: cytidylate kinase-like family protein [Anaerolineae bacterium]|nr:cytidylate kinase-like family protein [Anaerolineae bacterium]HQI84154.1 cytidylate kinase-like family protein [Anaerolineae bacterium]
MPVITISRQYGSGGDAIARRVCEALGYSYFDKSLIARVASEASISEDEIVDFTEDSYKMRGFVDRLFGRRRSAADAWISSAPQRALPVEMLDEARNVNLVKDVILEAHKHDNVIIVGRGGQAILQEQPGVLHVRVVAPLGARVLRVQEQEKCSLDEASARVKRKDEAAAAYLERFFDIDWDNPLLYHLIINTGKWDLEDAKHLILNALTHLKMVVEK